MRLRILLMVALTPLLLVNCHDTPTGVQYDSTATRFLSSSEAHGPIVNKVVGQWVGDLGHQGTFAFSFVARRYADGTVKGRWQLSGVPAFTGEVVCLTVIDNAAWIGTHWSTVGPGIGGVDEGYGGFRIVDNGDGSDDPADQLSRFYFHWPTEFHASDYCATTPPAPTWREPGLIRIRVD